MKDLILIWERQITQVWGPQPSASAELSSILFNSNIYLADVISQKGCCYANFSKYMFQKHIIVPPQQELHPHINYIVLRGSTQLINFVLKQMYHIFFGRKAVA